MASLFTTGPAFLYVAFQGLNPPATTIVPGAGAGAVGGGALINVPVGGAAIAAASSPSYVFLGTARTKPKIQIFKGNKPVYNDIGGGEIPFDLMYTGEMAVISADLNRFNHAVMERVGELPVVRDLPGLDEFGDVGTLTLTEGFSCMLVVAFPFATKPAMRAQGLRLGYRFVATTYEGPDEQEPGTTDYSRQVIFRALRAYFPLTGRFILFDQNLRGLPNPN